LAHLGIQKEYGAGGKAVVYALGGYGALLFALGRRLGCPAGCFVGQKLKLERLPAEGAGFVLGLGHSPANGANAHGVQHRFQDFNGYGLQGHFICLPGQPVGGRLEKAQGHDHLRPFNAQGVQGGILPVLGAGLPPEMQQLLAGLLHLGRAFLYAARQDAVQRVIQHPVHFLQFFPHLVPGCLYGLQLEKFAPGQKILEKLFHRIPL
jgi:hypothetical protein